MKIKIVEYIFDTKSILIAW